MHRVFFSLATGHKTMSKNMIDYLIIGIAVIMAEAMCIATLIITSPTL